MSEPRTEADDRTMCECGQSMDAHCGGFALLHHDEVLRQQEPVLRGALERIVRVWEEKAEDTIGENVLALTPAIQHARKVLVLAIEREASAPQTLDVERLMRAIAGDDDPDDHNEWWTTPRAFAAAIADEYARLSREEPSDE